MRPQYHQQNKIYVSITIYPTAPADQRNPLHCNSKYNYGYETEMSVHLHAYDYVGYIPVAHFNILLQPHAGSTPRLLALGIVQNISSFHAYICLNYGLR